LRVVEVWECENEEWRLRAVYYYAKLVGLVL
jgi:hypothetical protein